MVLGTTRTATMRQAIIPTATTPSTDIMTAIT